MKSNQIVLLDGGIGQEIYKRAGSPESQTLWSLQIMRDNPEIVVGVHTDFINAGSKVLSLNNYAATPSRLERIAMRDSFEEIHSLSIQLLNTAISKSKYTRSDLSIAGCLPPLIASYTAEDSRENKKLFDEYVLLIEQQIDHVDLFLVETLSSIREIIVVTDALDHFGLGKYISLTLDDDNPNLLRSGENLVDAIKLLEMKSADAILLNCSCPETISSALSEFKNIDIPFGAYANGFSSVKDLKFGKSVNVLEARNDLGPDEYSEFVMDWIGKGARIIGGCCEIGPKHINRVSDQLHLNGYTTMKLGL
jgi:homocysteine S-methyltransferase